jgi:hypothetical protein
MVPLSACSPNPYPFDKDKFTDIVNSWELDKNSPNYALNLLEQKGFSVSRNKAEKWFEDENDYIYATQKLRGIVCSLEWRIILYTEHEQIFEVKPLVFSSCL